MFQLAYSKGTMVLSTSVSAHRRRQGISTQGNTWENTQNGVDFLSIFQIQKKLGIFSIILMVS